MKITLTSETYLDFAFDLSTSSNLATPSINQITVNYNEEGVYEDVVAGIDYRVQRVSSTNTNIIKLLEGTKNLKVNILI